MTSCSSALALERYLVGELAAPDERAHIAGCVRCQTELATMRIAGDAYMTSRAARDLARSLGTAPVLRRARTSRTVVAAIGLAVGLALAAIAALVVWPRAAGTSREAEVLAVERAWMSAYVAHDATALDAILASNYTLTDGKGQITTKADDLAHTRAHAMEYDAYDTSDLRVRVWGDTAVVTGRAHVRGRGLRGPFDSAFTFTDTLAHIDGRWRAVAAHVSAAPR